jgi:hypothetical protein
LQNGTTWNPMTSSKALAPGDFATISEDYPVPLNTNSTVTDTLFATNSQAELIEGHPLTATVNTTFRAMSVSQTSVAFPAMAFGSAPPAVQTFDIVDTTNGPLVISDVSMAATAQSDAFTLTYLLNGGAVTKPPFTLQPNDKLTVQVHLDQANKYALTNLAGIVNITSDACITPPTVAVAAQQTIGEETVGGYTSGAIFACGNETNNVTYTQEALPGVTQALPNLPIAHITGVVIAGPDRANFSLQGQTSGIDVVAGSSQSFPVTFTPSPATGLKTYNAQVEITVHHDAAQSSLSDQTYTIPLTGTANSIVASATSVFANNSGAAGEVLSLPIDLTVNKNGLTIPLASMNITGSKLVYILPDSDLLHVVNITTALSNAPHDWTVQPGSGLVGKTLTIILKGNIPLDDNDRSLGKVDFLVTLAKEAATTAVKLESLELTSNGAPVSGCVSPQVQSGNFDLILRCGDETMRKVMAGQPIGFIKPATPDPVTGGSITFEYGNRIETNITLAIYDALGKEVARPVNNIHHDAGAWQIATNVSSLANGTYTYRLSSGKTVKSGQFVIQR